MQDPIFIDEKCVIVSQEQFNANKELRERAEAKLRQLEDEQKQQELRPPAFGNICLDCAHNRCVVHRPPNAERTWCCHSGATSLGKLHDAGCKYKNLSLLELAMAVTSEAEDGQIPKPLLAALHRAIDGELRTTLTSEPLMTTADLEFLFSMNERLLSHGEVHLREKFLILFNGLSKRVAEHEDGKARAQVSLRSVDRDAHIKVLKWLLGKGL